MNTENKDPVLCTASKINKGKFLVLLLMVTVYPIVMFPGDITGFTLPKYVALALAAAAALFLIIYSRSINLKRRSFIPLGFFLIFVLISTIMAPEPLNAWFGVYRYTGFCTYLFCTILFFLATDCDEPEKTLKWMAATAALVSLIAVLQYLGLNFIPHYFHKSIHPYSTIGNRNFVGTYTVFILPAAIFFYLCERKTFWLGCVALVYAGLLVTLTRGVWLALPLPLLILLYSSFRKPENRKNVCIICITLLLTTGLLAPIHDWLLVKRAFSIPDQIVQTIELIDTAGAGRIYIWKEALKLIPENWAFGIGPDHLAIPLPSGIIADKAHNIYLEIAVTMGIFALISYLCFLTFFLRPAKDETGLLFFSMVLAYLLQGFFNIDVVAVMPLFWITLGLSPAMAGPRATVPWPPGLPCRRH